MSALFTQRTEHHWSYSYSESCSADKHCLMRNTLKTALYKKVSRMEQLVDYRQRLLKSHM